MSDYIKKEGMRILAGYGMPADIAETHVLDAINQHRRGRLATGAALFSFLNKRGKAFQTALKKKQREEQRRF